MNTQCQSCGMPLKKDPKQGGTNRNGSKSEKYCSYCYEEGNFLQPDWTAQQMQEFCRVKMKEMGFPGFLASLFTRGIPKLERWSNS